LAEFRSDCRRDGQGCRRDVEIDRADPVFHLRDGISECTAEFLGRVVEVVDAASGLPLDLERNNRWDRLPGVAGYRVFEIQIILHVKVVHFEDGGAGARVKLDVAWREDRRPEETILRDAGVEVMNLCAPQLGVVDVNSDKRESARSNVAISALIDSLHKRHMILR